MPRTPTRPHTTSCCFAVPPRRPFRPCPKAKKGENNIASALDKLDGFACFLCCYICVPFFVLGIDSWAPARRHCCGGSRTLPGSLVRRKQERVCEGAEEEEEEEGGGGRTERGKNEEGGTGVGGEVNRRRGRRRRVRAQHQDP